MKHKVSFIIPIIFALASPAHALIAATLPAKQSTQTNTNQIYLERFIKAVEKTNKNNPDLPLIVQQIRKDSATTTDLVSTFLKQAAPVNKNQKKAPSKLGFVGDLLASLVDLVIKPKEADASIGLPFGGPLLYVYPCTCSPAWVTFTGPTANPLTSDLLLTYITGSQAYGYYTLPFSPHILGTYLITPPACYMYAGISCIPFYTEGTITPLVGSALL
jgi:hypothetical protein